MQFLRSINTIVIDKVNAMIAPHPVTGIGLAGVCLCILGVMPVISNSRPEGFDALGFAFFLSVW